MVQILLTCIWLRRYPTMHHLAMHFGISVSCVHRIIHRIIPMMHVCVVRKFIKWPTHQEWQNLAGFYQQWPRVVGIIDGTPFRISKPKGKYMKVVSCHILPLRKIVLFYDCVCTWKLRKRTHPFQIECLSTTSSDDYFSTSSIHGNVNVWNINRQLQVCLVFSLAAIFIISSCNYCL